MGTGNAAADAALRILVVEDEALIALELESLLDDLGHVTVGVAGSLHAPLPLSASSVATSPTTARSRRSLQLLMLTFEKDATCPGGTVKVPGCGGGGAGSFSLIWTEIVSLPT